LNALNVKYVVVPSTVYEEGKKSKLAGGRFSGRAFIIGKFYI